MINKLALLALSAAFALAACDRQAAAPRVAPDAASNAASDAASDTAPAETAEASAPAEEPAASRVAEPIPTKADEIAWPATRLHAKIITSKGDMLVDLYPDKAPKTVANFVQYAKDGFYDQLVFHRVVEGFVIQAGGFNRYMNERPTRAPIPYEGDNGLGNYRTTLAMARTSDPGSAAAQWYVNLRDNNEGLDHFVNDLGPRYGYAVFGRVVEGMDVADAIGAVRTGPGGPFEAEVPKEPIVISRIDIIEDAP